MKLRKGQLDNLLIALSHEGFSLPYSASVRDYPNPKDLHQADTLAWWQNQQALERALKVI